MAVVELAGPSAEVQQKYNHNSNVGGGYNLRQEYSVPAGASWAVVGMVLVDGATAANVASTLVPAIEALSVVTSVHGNQFFGKVDTEILAANHEAVLHVLTQTITAIGSGGDTFVSRALASEQQKPPVDKKFCVMLLRVPDPLDATAIATLETAIEGVTGVTTAEHLVDGTVSSRAAQNAQFTINVHLRIEPTG